MPENIKMVPISTPVTAPSGLNACANVSRLSAVSGEPSWAIKGLAAVSKNERPLARTKSSKQEKEITTHYGCWPEKNRSCAKEQKSSHKACFIAILPHQQSSRESKAKVTHIKGRLHQPSLKSGNSKRLHKLTNQYIIQIVRNAP